MVENLIKFISNPLPFFCRVPVLHRYRKVQFGFLLHEEIAHSISFFVKQLSFSSVLINSPFEASLFWIKVFSVWTSNLEYFGIGHLKTTKRPPPVGPTHYPSEETQFFSFSFFFFGRLCQFAVYFLSEISVLKWHWRSTKLLSWERRQNEEDDFSA